MKQYIELLNSIKEKGTYKPAAREGMPGTTSLFGYQFRHDLTDGFPLLTTKKVNFNHIVAELLWFLKGDTNIKYLVDNGCNIWNEDAYNYYIKLCKKNNISEPVNFEDFIKFTKQGNVKDYFPNYKFGDCGEQYGKLWRDFGRVNYYHVKTGQQTINGVDQIKDLIEGLKANPMSRRHIITAWNPNTLDDMALNACHAMFQFNCRPLTEQQKHEYWWFKILGFIPEYNTQEQYSTAFEKIANTIPSHYLDCQMYQRSADVFLGVPYNIASYALLTEILCKICNMIPGEMIYTYGDVHIYDNHQEQVILQLTRQEKPLPTLKINREDLPDFWEELFEEHFSLKDFELRDYNPHPGIKAKLSTGLQ